MGEGPAQPMLAAGCVHSEAAGYEAWLLLLMDVVKGQWEVAVGSVSRLWQGVLLGVSRSVT